MGVHLVGVDRPAEVRILRVGPFEGHFEVKATVPAGCPEPEERLICARLSCQKGGRELTGEDCLMCSRFRGWRDGPDARSITISCAWSHHDPVWARMTEGTALLAVAPDATCRDADEAARRADVRHVLAVNQEDRLVGILCRCDLVGAPPDAPVSAYMSQEIFAIPRNATLEDAVSALAGLRIGCLPVVSDGIVVGIITRGDLRRAGVSEQLLGASTCACCASPHGVTQDRRQDLELCLDCLDRETPADGDELGDGD
jgi:hypothetical protein